MDKKFVITIAREYGSGGRTIGEMLAKDLGVEYYDKDLIRKASEDSGINVDLFAHTDEKHPFKGFLNKFKKKNYGGEVLSPSDSDYTSEENLYNIQAQAIRDLADKESCIIIGRAADYILKDRDDVISVFVHAPMPTLIQNASKKLSMEPKEIEKFIINTDKERATYYTAHTGREWTDARNYDLCLDSSKLGYDKCVEAIKAYMDVKFK